MANDSPQLMHGDPKLLAKRQFEASLFQGICQFCHKLLRKQGLLANWVWSTTDKLTVDAYTFKKRVQKRAPLQIDKFRFQVSSDNVKNNLCRLNASQF